MSKILLIEDNRDIRDNLGEFLELSNYQVVSANNGREGIERIQEVMPDLILCDIAMPEMDGYQVLEHIRSKATTAKIPFVFITSSAQKQDIEKGRLAGADAYLPKPFPTRKLVDTIERLLEENMIPK